MVIECKNEIRGVKRLNEMIASVLDERIAREAYKSWRADKEKIMSDIKEAYDGKLPEKLDNLLALVHAAGYKNGIMDNKEIWK